MLHWVVVENNQYIGNTATLQQSMNGSYEGINTKHVILVHFWVTLFPSLSAPSKHNHLYQSFEIFKYTWITFSHNLHVWNKSSLLIGSWQNWINPNLSPIFGIAIIIECTWFNFYGVQWPIIIKCIYLNQRLISFIKFLSTKLVLGHVQLSLMESRIGHPEV